MPKVNDLKCLDDPSIRQLCFGLFRRYHTVLHKPLRVKQITNGTASPMDANKMTSYLLAWEISPAYRLSVIHLAISHYMLPEAREHSALSQAKALMLVMQDHRYKYHPDEIEPMMRGLADLLSNRARALLDHMREDRQRGMSQLVYETMINIYSLSLKKHPHGHQRWYDGADTGQSGMAGLKAGLEDAEENMSTRHFGPHQYQFTGSDVESQVTVQFMFMMVSVLQVIMCDLRFQRYINASHPGRDDKLRPYEIIKTVDLMASRKDALTIVVFDLLLMGAAHLFIDVLRAFPYVFMTLCVIDAVVCRHMHDWLDPQSWFADVDWLSTHNPYVSRGNFPFPSPMASMFRSEPTAKAALRGYYDVEKSKGVLYDWDQWLVKATRDRIDKDRVHHRQEGLFQRPSQVVTEKHVDGGAAAVVANPSRAVALGQSVGALLESWNVWRAPERKIKHKTRPARAVAVDVVTEEVEGASPLRWVEAGASEQVFAMPRNPLEAIKLRKEDAQTDVYPLVDRGGRIVCYATMRGGVPPELEGIFDRGRIAPKQGAQGFKRVDDLWEIKQLGAHGDQRFLQEIQLPGDKAKPPLLVFSSDPVGHRQVRRAAARL